MQILADGNELLRVVVVGLSAYVALIVLLRISGKRTLARMNAFDLIVTVAFGSTLATVLLSKDVSLAEGVLAFGVLIGGQFVITFASVRSDRLEHLVKSEPTMLFFRGRYLHDAMRRQRVTEGEIRAAIRYQGIAAVEEVYAVVLETDGGLAVIGDKADAGRSAMRDVVNQDGHSA